MIRFYEIWALLSLFPAWLIYMSSKKQRHDLGQIVVRIAISTVIAGVILFIAMFGVNNIQGL
jgi:hypothetical protein